MTIKSYKVTSIEDQVFSMFSALSSIILDSGLTILGAQMFETNGLGNSVQSIVIVSTITSIGIFVFVNIIK